MPDAEETTEMEAAWDDGRAGRHLAVMGAVTVCVACALCLVPGIAHGIAPPATVGAVAVVLTRLWAWARDVRALSRPWQT
ncbi:hypothetical protein ACIP9H_37745 [Streptomyces sp. NPDC088732]|uniref:hypothetical protein n=1 Tax=Streptomyces sp. NPDC088732 TaxID=3365879 RepID=UPI0037F8BC89